MMRSDARQYFWVHKIGPKGIARSEHKNTLGLAQRKPEGVPCSFAGARAFERYKRVAECPEALAHPVYERQERQDD